MISNWKTLSAGVITSAVILLPLTVWTLGYKRTDIAAFILFPMILVLGACNFQLSAATKKSYLQVAFLETSKLRNIFTGQISAFIGSFCFAVTTGVLLGLNVLSLSEAEIETYLGLLFAGVLLSSILASWTQNQLKSPYSHSFSVNISTIVLSLLFVPVVVWVNWNFVHYPGMIKTATLSEALNYSSSLLPSRRTWLVELVAVFDAFSMIKLWLVIKLNSPTWARLIFSFDTAIASILLARGLSVINVYILKILSLASASAETRTLGIGEVNDARG